ncbi:hypothetical protein HUU62_13415 [Rhodoferax sp. 4810]|uniref:PEP-CTERM protein-sorting domain-containing protein n=1 Tax=Thiospirillum jenense TaxID=1653858 RepID=A0A839HI58_9GAMM|nr:hypothetical protein [Thiospirillum jenense]MBB1075408.1 hypothetical protein [Rhodoferax jenense]MBB1126786.1 hypothetical protein [Thiospirillum jenense]
MKLSKLSIKKTTLSIALAGAMGLITTHTNASEILLPGYWGLSIDGGANILGIEALALDGWSHLDNDFSNPNTDGSFNFIENGLLQVTGYRSLISGGTESITYNAATGYGILPVGYNLYIAWENLTGTQVVNPSSGVAQVSFDTGKTLHFFLDTAPVATGTPLRGAPFTNWSNQLTEIARLSVIPQAVNSVTGVTEHTGGNFDLARGEGNGDSTFILWHEMDVNSGYLFNVNEAINDDGSVDATRATDLDLQDTDFAGFAGDTTTDIDLQARIQTGSARTLFTNAQDTAFEEMMDGIFPGASGTDPEHSFNQIENVLSSGMQIYNDFYVNHKGLANFDLQVSEPTSLALLGIGLFSTAGASRIWRKAA